MRRLVAVLTLISLLVSSLVFFALPVSADANTEQCWISEFSYRNDTSSPATVDLTLHDSSPQTALYQTTDTLQPGETKTVSIHGLFPLSSSSFSSSATSATLTFLGFGNFGRVDFSVCASFGRIGDGRINDGGDQLGAPLAAYCASDGGIAVWDISDVGEGTLGFTATGADISAALANAAQSGQNVLVGEGLGNSLYALANGNLMLTGPDVKEAGKIYQFFAGADVCS